MIRACPCVVAAIVEMRVGDKDKVLIQERWKPSVDPVYSGYIELPGGLVEPYEPIESALRREVFEETGLAVDINGSHGWTSPFIITQQLKGGLPWVALVYRCRVVSGTMCSSQEARNQRWADRDEIQRILTEGRAFPLYIDALIKYIGDLRH